MCKPSRERFANSIAILTEQHGIVYIRFNACLYIYTYLFIYLFFFIFSFILFLFLFYGKLYSIWSVGDPEEHAGETLDSRDLGHPEVSRSLRPISSSCTLICDDVPFFTLHIVLALMNSLLKKYIYIFNSNNFFSQFETIVHQYI